MSPTKAEIQDELDELKEKLKGREEELEETKMANEELYELATANALNPPEPDYTEKQKEIMKEIDGLFERHRDLHRRKDALKVFTEVILQEKYLPMSRSEAKQMKDYFKKQMDWEYFKKSKSPQKAGEQMITSRDHAYRTQGK